MRTPYFFLMENYMYVYKAEIIKYRGFNPCSYTNEVHIEETGFFSTIEKANEYILRKGFIFSPVLILCGNKVVRVCKDSNEASSLLTPSPTNQALLDLFHTNSTEFENKWILPCYIVNKELDAIKDCVYANVDEIEVM